MTALSDSGLLRILQLSSSALPVGGYAFSQGLEFAIEEKWLKNSFDVRDWIATVLDHTIAKTDLPLLIRLVEAFKTHDFKGVKYWNLHVLACRETLELRDAEIATGKALVKLLKGIKVEEVAVLKQSLSFVAAYAFAVSFWKIDVRVACHGFVWSWMENQVAAATKLLPLGQSAAQDILNDLIGIIPSAVSASQSASDEEIGSSLPGLAMASALHETQYTRLFRS
ncbi:MAG: urease accessory protein UreF [Porticoccaceae bacterium]|nr:urease accessory protein UreF [Porticoccaceae bacterium]|tara:strand:+ start:2570 stop:3244 length:675 start_codon:yes stop_codon:yes gene_type:complete